MFDGPDRTSHELEDFPPNIPHEDIEELKELDGFEEESLLRDEKPVARSLGPSMGCLVAFVPGFLRSRFVVGLLQLLVPSFLRSEPAAPKRLHSTAWLDGMRGVSALCVAIYHSSLVWFAVDLHYKLEPGSFEILKMPIIRLLVSGPPHVAMFFIVSGYAISHKPLKLMHQGRFADVGSALGSAFFRRHPRLFMPAAVVTFFTALMTQLNWFDPAGQGLPGTAFPTREPPHANNLYDQMLHFAMAEIQNTDPVGQEHVTGTVPRRVANPYDPNLWTLPIEFNSSMVVFMFLAAFSRVRNRVRMAFAFALLVYFEYFWAYWALFLFLSGMLICDLHFEIDDYHAQSAKRGTSGDGAVLPLWTRVPHGIVSKIARTLLGSRFLGRITGISLFILALWLLSLYEQEPIDTFHTHLGAILIVFVVDHAPFLQIIFTNSFSQYLGRISYSLYLVHGPLLWTLGAALGHRCLAFTGADTNEQWVLGIAMAACLWWPVAIWVSDLTYRVVDAKCVQLARWSYEKLLKKDS
ncbi:hard surface induced protein 3 [Diaporthe helianthi]|uniref:Hard surface induced protein 3 n=1 Tax=Diaporthe helianthi TaxID=158607 RepID=A0A2P5I1Q5_DIAHE|nr:hard surface induced protein 3 [Diaporthe helianthi]